MKELKSCIVNFFNFKGKATRKEFFIFLIIWFFSFLLIPWPHKNERDVLTSIFIMTFPLLPISARRLRDAGNSVLWILFYFFPFVNLILLLCLITKATSLKNQAVNLFSQVYVNVVGLSQFEAEMLISHLYDLEEKKAKENGTYYLPFHLGNNIVDRKYPSNPRGWDIYEKTIKRMPRLKNESVRNEDIKWWWNLTEMERLMINANDENIRFIFFVGKLQEISNEYSSREAAELAANEIVKKTFSIYGYEDSPTFDQDAPLPFELKDRVDIYMENLCITGEINNLSNRTNMFSSFNAFIRSEIKAGNL